MSGTRKQPGNPAGRDRSLRAARPTRTASKRRQECRPCALTSEGGALRGSAGFRATSGGASGGGLHAVFAGGFAGFVAALVLVLVLVLALVLRALLAFRARGRGLGLGGG